MAIRITEDDVVNYENSPDVNRKLFPNLNICGKEIDELAEEIDGKAPAVFSTASGSTASFDNGADDMPLKSCVVSFEPIQSGEGDPSPENICPISGRTGMSVVRSGKNLIDFASVYGNIQTITFSDGVWSGPANAFRGARIQIPKAFIGKTLVFSAELTTQGSNARVAATIDGATKNGTPVANADVVKSVLVTTPVSEDDTIWINYSSQGTTTVKNPQLELGSTATDFEPYKGTTYSVNWKAEAGTVYGGALDIVSGKLTVDRANIASYDGETLPSTWISDRDVYAAGTTPTTGAQVVYNLTEPIEYQLKPQEIATLFGINNIWSDAGDASVEYPTDTKLYIDDIGIKTVEITGQTPTITAEENTRYICGEVTSLSFTPCEKGICDVRFTAASISTVLTLPETVKLPEWFDPTLLEAGTTYEINILDGVYGVVMSWA